MGTIEMNGVSLRQAVESWITIQRYLNCTEIKPEEFDKLRKQIKKESVHVHPDKNVLKSTAAKEEKVGIFRGLMSVIEAIDNVKNYADEQQGQGKEATYLAVAAEAAQRPGAAQHPGAAQRPGAAPHQQGQLQAPASASERYAEAHIWEMTIAQIKLYVKDEKDNNVCTTPFCQLRRQVGSYQSCSKKCFELKKKIVDPRTKLFKAVMELCPVGFDELRKYRVAAAIYHNLCTWPGQWCAFLATAGKSQGKEGHCKITEFVKDQLSRRGIQTVATENQPAESSSDLHTAMKRKTCDVEQEQAKKKPKIEKAGNSSVQVTRDTNGTHSVRVYVEVPQPQTSPNGSNANGTGFVAMEEDDNAGEKSQTEQYFTTQYITRMAEWKLSTLDNLSMQNILGELG